MLRKTLSERKRGFRGEHYISFEFKMKNSLHIKG